VLNDELLKDYVRCNEESTFIRMDPEEDDPVGIGLKHELLDTLPDLPALRKSASLGCEFCAVLTEAVRTRSSHPHWPHSAKVQFLLGRQFPMLSRPQYV